MLKNKLFWLIVIFIFGLTARIFYSNVFPPSLNWDEVSHGFNAYSLLKTGRDEWGVAMPLLFRAFGDYKLPVYVYLTVPISFMPRLPSIIFGSLTILISSFLAYELTKRNRVMLSMALLVAFEPWTWFFSRVALEANVSLTLILLGVLLFLRRKNLAWLLFFGGLAMWSYNSARVFVPLGLFIVAIKYWRSLLKPINIAILIALFLPVGWQILSPAGSARFRWTSLLDQGAINRINETRGRSQLPVLASKLVYNKVTYFVTQSTISFASYFNPGYWLGTGGSQYQYTVQGHGIIYWIDAIWFISGLVVLVKNKRLGILILLWFMLAIIPGSITRDAPHPLRTIYAVFPILFTLALGVHKKVWPIFLLALTIFFSQYLWIASNYTKTYSWSWQYGYSQIADYIKLHGSDYDQIIITKRYGEPHEFLAYYLPFNPKTFQNTKDWNFHDDWYWVDGFQKYRFVNDWEIKSQKHIPGKKILVICSPETVVSGAIKKEIKFLDSKPAFVLVEI